MKRGPYKTRRDHLSEASPFTSVVLRDLLERKVLPGPKAMRQRLRMPTAAALDHLAGILNVHHAYFYDAQECRAFNELAKEAEAAIAALSAVLPRLAAFHQRGADAGDPFARWRADAARRLAVEVGRDPRRIVERETAPDHVRGWRWLVDVLPPLLATALESTNPEVKLGDEGPAARFVAAVVPFLSGEHPTVNTVAERLKERTQEKAATNSVPQFVGSIS